MKRRTFITLVGSAAAWPLAARAQQPAMPLVGVLGSASPVPFLTSGLIAGLRETGFIEGQNVRIEDRWARGALDRLPQLAAELVGLRPALVATFGIPAVHAIKNATAKAVPPIPVIFAMGNDPVVEGLVASFNRPGGSMTGVTTVSGALAPKRMELVREFLRGSTVGILVNPEGPVSQSEREDADRASRAIGLRLEVFNARNEQEIETAFPLLEQRQASALIVATDQFYFTQMQRIATLASRYRVPAIGPLREFAVEGGLMSYGASVYEANRQAGVYVGRVLKGARPADLPILQPTKFDLVINLKSSKALAIEISPKLLSLADEVIE
jgi:ABC-type uncharacterized transport system substrate-binding protein